MNDHHTRSLQPHLRQPLNQVFLPRRADFNRPGPSRRRKWFNSKDFELRFDTVVFATIRIPPRRLVVARADVDAEVYVRLCDALRLVLRARKSPNRARKRGCTWMHAKRGENERRKELPDYRRELIHLRAFARDTLSRFPLLVSLNRHSPRSVCGRIRPLTRSCSFTSHTHACVYAS